MSSIPINYTLTENYNIVNMKIEITQLILFTSAQFRVTFFNDNNEIVKSQVLMMSGAEYMAWCDNDQYVIQWIKNQLGIS